VGRTHMGASRAGTDHSVPREVGWGNAMRYILTGDHWSAQEPYRTGEVREIARDTLLMSVRLFVPPPSVWEGWRGWLLLSRDVHPAGLSK
jgi:enoyl-CoA hydratase/carnithine racemase